MWFSEYYFSQGKSMDNNHAVSFITVLALAANLVVAGVTAVVPPGAQDFKRLLHAANILRRICACIWISRSGRGLLCAPAGMDCRRAHFL